ncbi:MAG: DUF2807 domain-containing protein [Bacteroidota bacterium]
MKNWILFSVAALLLASCNKDNREYPNPAEQTFNLTGFKRINTGESFNVTIIKGADFSIKAKGRSADLADLNLSVVAAGDVLEIKYNHYEPNRYRVDFTITLPVLNQLTLSGNGKGTINGFAGQSSSLRAILSGNAELNLTGVSINLPIDLSGNAKLDVSGNTLSLYGNISGNAALHAYDVIATDVDLGASGNAHAYVFPQQSFFADASGESRVFYKGNPVQTNLTTSGNGKIIRE